MKVNDLIAKRRSIRKYKMNSPITNEEIKTILTAGMMAPSACNKRPWEFMVIESEEAKEKVLRIHPHAKHFESASAGILVCARPELQAGISEGYFPQDCGAVIQNMLLQATELGLGTCWCGIYPRMDRVELFKNEFNLDSVPVALIIIGKADEEPEAKGFYEESKVRFI